MASKFIGRLYIRIDGRIYKIATMQAGKDGSIYIGIPLGSGLQGQGVGGHKFTYHPDGNNWMTSELYLKDFGSQVPDETIKQLQGWEDSGLGMRNGKLYSKKYAVNTPLTDVWDMMKLRFGISYRDIHNDYKDRFEETTQHRKISTATIIDGKPYKHLTLSFYFVRQQYLALGLQSLGAVEKYYFEHSHPRLNTLYIVVVVTDEWAGDKQTSS